MGGGGRRRGKLKKKNKKKITPRWTRKEDWIESLMNGREEK